jgi:hypothetical protein
VRSAVMIASAPSLRLVASSTRSLSDGVVVDCADLGRGHRALDGLTGRAGRFGGSPFFVMSYELRVMRYVLRVIHYPYPYPYPYLHHSVSALLLPLPLGFACRCGFGGFGCGVWHCVFIGGGDTARTLRRAYATRQESPVGASPD